MSATLFLAVQLINACKQVAENSAVLVGSVRVFSDNADDALAQLKVCTDDAGASAPRTQRFGC